MSSVKNLTKREIICRLILGASQDVKDKLRKEFSAEIFDKIISDTEKELLEIQATNIFLG